MTVKKLVSTKTVIEAAKKIETLNHACLAALIQIRLIDFTISSWLRLIRAMHSHISTILAKVSLSLKESMSKLMSVT